MRTAIKYVVGWLVAVGLGVDILLSGIFGGAPGESISTRLGQARQRGSIVGALGCLPLDFMDPGHCQRAIAPR